MSYGMKIRNEAFNDIQCFCDNEQISLNIWASDDKYTEIEFETLRELGMVKTHYARYKELEKYL